MNSSFKKPVIFAITYLPFRRFQYMWGGGKEGVRLFQQLFRAERQNECIFKLSVLYFSLVVVLSSYGHQTAQEKNVMLRKVQKIKLHLECHSPSQEIFLHVSFLIAPLGFPIAKRTHPYVWKSIYSLFTLQLWEKSIPWFVFVLAFLVCGYCCRKVLILA